MQDIPFKKLIRGKILVGIPTNEVKNYCVDDLISRVKTYSYKPYDIMVVDNSKERTNQKFFAKNGIHCEWVNPKNKSNQKYIAESLEVLRMAALRGGYSHLAINESDIFPPQDVWEKLVMHQKPVVSASYFIGQGEKSHLMIQESAGELFMETFNIEAPFDILKADGRLNQVYACGIGCILIHRSVLELITFRHIDNMSPHPDSYFALDLYAQQIPQYVDTSILCEHRNQDWDMVADENKELRIIR